MFKFGVLHWHLINPDICVINFRNRGATLWRRDDQNADEQSAFWRSEF